MRVSFTKASNRLELRVLSICFVCACVCACLLCFLCPCGVLCLCVCVWPAASAVGGCRAVVCVGRVCVVCAVCVRLSAAVVAADAVCGVCGCGPISCFYRLSSTARAALCVPEPEARATAVKQIYVQYY